MKIGVEFYIEAIIGMIMITGIIDPVKVFFFNSIIGNDEKNRKAAAAKVALIVAGILVGSVLIGRELLQLIGIDLGAFGIVGGVVVAGMGFEMLYGGGPSHPQGAKESEEGPMSGDNLVMPLAVPLIAGPGAITAAITLTSAEDSGAALLAGLLGVAAVVIVTFVLFVYFGNVMAKMSERTAALVTRLGGLLLATIGLQIALGGFRTYFGI